MDPMAPVWLFCPDCRLLTEVLNLQLELSPSSEILAAQSMIYLLRDLHNNHPYLIPHGAVTVGRSDDATVMIEHESISRRHASIQNLPDGIWIEDLNSTNGTIVRGELITQITRLQPGEVFQIGQMDFLLDPEAHEESNPPEAVPAPQISWDKFQRKTHKLRRREILAQIPVAPGVTRTVSSGSTSAIPARTGSGMIHGLSAWDVAPDSRPVVPWRLVIGLAVGAGVAVGMVLGLMLAKLLLA